MKKTCLLLLSVLLGFTSISDAAEPAVKGPAKGEVLEFGRFELIAPEQKATESNSPAGKESNSTGARFVEKTNRIPATTGTRFGFRYKITGVIDEATATLKMVVVHPPIKNAKGEIERRNTLEQEVAVRNGVITEVTGYSLEQAEELVPGNWVFEVWYRGQRLITQSFTTIR